MSEAQLLANTCPHVTHGVLGQRPGQAERGLPPWAAKAQQPPSELAPLIRWVNFKGAPGEGVGRAADSGRSAASGFPSLPPPQARPPARPASKTGPNCALIWGCGFRRSCWLREWGERQPRVWAVTQPLHPRPPRGRPGVHLAPCSRPGGTTVASSSEQAALGPWLRASPCNRASHCLLCASVSSLRFQLGPSRTGRAGTVLLGRQVGQAL